MISSSWNTDQGSFSVRLHACIPNRMDPFTIRIGNQLIDQVSFGGITIPEQGIGSAILDDGFQGVDGIIG